MSGLEHEAGSSLQSGLRRIAIQGERGSNSHMAALKMLGAFGEDVDIVPHALSAEVIESVVIARVDAAVLPIENSLHGSVAEHYDLLLANPVRIDCESHLRIRHNLIVAPGVALADVRHVLSHPVALSQCRRYLASLTQAHAIPFYDTAGSVKHLMAERLQDTAGVAPALAAREYGAQILAEGIEDNAENYTRFHLICSENASLPVGVAPDKLSVAFAVEHRPGTLVSALRVLADAGVDLTKIESRPVPGSPWEYIFYVDFRFPNETAADEALAALRQHCSMVKELGRYKAA